ncbi:MAG: sporulation transcriptional regulator SpoIIID [Clostridia bacterium]|nr:sporulation transcriptional regulator SpoIIID [Clostridia bacterium]
MRELADDRAVILGQYILETGATVRATAKVFSVSKSTVHKDVTEKLRYKNPNLFKQVKEVLELNKQERHIRGGLATKRKYIEKYKKNVDN